MQVNTAGRIAQLLLFPISRAELLSGKVRRVWKYRKRVFGKHSLMIGRPK